MKKIYLKPLCNVYMTTVESGLMVDSQHSKPTDFVNEVGDGQFELIGEGDGGDEAEAKKNSFTDDDWGSIY